MRQRTRTAVSDVWPRVEPPPPTVPAGSRAYNVAPQSSEGARSVDVDPPRAQGLVRRVGNRIRRTGVGPPTWGSPHTDVVVHGQIPTAGAPRPSFLAASASCVGQELWSLTPPRPTTQPMIVRDRGVKLLHLTPALSQSLDGRGQEAGGQARCNDCWAKRLRHPRGTAGSTTVRN